MDDCDKITEKIVKIKKGENSEKILDHKKDELKDSYKSYYQRFKIYYKNLVKLHERWIKYINLLIIEIKNQSENSLKFDKGNNSFGSWFFYQYGKIVISNPMVGVIHWVSFIFII